MISWLPWLLELQHMSNSARVQPATRKGQGHGSTGLSLSASTCGCIWPSESLQQTTNRFLSHPVLRYNQYFADRNLPKHSINPSVTVHQSRWQWSHLVRVQASRARMATPVYCGRSNIPHIRRLRGRVCYGTTIHSHATALLIFCLPKFWQDTRHITTLIVRGYTAHCLCVPHG